MCTGGTRPFLISSSSFDGVTRVWRRLDWPEYALSIRCGLSLSMMRTDSNHDCVVWISGDHATRPLAVFLGPRLMFISMHPRSRDLTYR